jgi:hypothetical protein
MPRINGGEVACRLRALGDAAPLLIVATTAHGVSDFRFLPYRGLFDRILCKPVNVTELDQLLASLP